MAWNPGSLRREKFSFSLALNFAWASTVSPLQPRITLPALSYPALASRNSDASLIHPGVCALGKKYKTTGLPRRSASAISRPSSAGKQNSGALSPCFSMIPPARALGKQPLQRVVNELRIRLPSRGFHHLPDKKLEHPFVPRLILRDIFGILRDYFAASLLDGGHVADLRQTL